MPPPAVLHKLDMVKYRPVVSWAIGFSSCCGANVRKALQICERRCTLAPTHRLKGAKVAKRRTEDLTWSITEAAKESNIGEDTIRELVAADHIPHVKIGSKALIVVDPFLEWLAEQARSHAQIKPGHQA